MVVTSKYDGPVTLNLDSKADEGVKMVKELSTSNRYNHLKETSEHKGER
jgi:hypothetical protein